MPFNTPNTEGYFYDGEYLQPNTGGGAPRTVEDELRTVLEQGFNAEIFGRPSMQQQANGDVIYRGVFPFYDGVMDEDSHVRDKLSEIRKKNSKKKGVDFEKTFKPSYD